MTSLPQLQAPVDLTSHWYQRVTVTGRYQAQTTKAALQGGGVGKQWVAVLWVDDQTLVDLFDRPADEANRLNGKQVVVTGQLQPPIESEPPFVMAKRDDLPALVDIDSVEVAPGG